ncbi:hypothetical protein ACFLRA_00530 [Bdellovibrionota bacterium]
MKNQKIKIAILTFIVSNFLIMNANAEPRIHRIPPPPNCLVIVDKVSAGGKELQNTYQFRVASKRECKKRSKLFSYNFDPKNIAKKKVSIKWFGD